MRLELDDGGGYAGPNVWLVLTESEARDLAEGLIVYFSEEPRDEGWHDHLGDHVALAIEPGDEPLGIRMGLDGEPL
jgi:hypothetical protein